MIEIERWRDREGRRFKSRVKSTPRGPSRRARLRTAGECPAWPSPSRSAPRPTPGTHRVPTPVHRRLRSVTIFPVLKKWKKKNRVLSFISTRHRHDKAREKKERKKKKKKEKLNNKNSMWFCESQKRASPQPRCARRSRARRGRVGWRASGPGWWTWRAARTKRSEQERDTKVT